MYNEAVGGVGEGERERENGVLAKYRPQPKSSPKECVMIYFDKSCLILNSQLPALNVGRVWSMVNLISLPCKDSSLKFSFNLLHGPEFILRI
jgi:hypothetical protein